MLSIILKVKTRDLVCLSAKQLPPLSPSQPLYVSLTEPLLAFPSLTSKLSESWYPCTKPGSLACQFPTGSSLRRPAVFQKRTFLLYLMNESLVSLPDMAYLVTYLLPVDMTRF